MKFNFYSDDVVLLQNENNNNQCTIEKSNKNDNKLWSIQCNDVGIHKFIMTNKNGNTNDFNVNIEKRQYCYRWNFITTFSESKVEPTNIILPGEEFKARLWVVSGEEENINSIVPSNVIY